MAFYQYMNGSFFSDAITISMLHAILQLLEYMAWVTANLKTVYLAI